MYEGVNGKYVNIVVDYCRYMSTHVCSSLNQDFCLELNQTSHIILNLLCSHIIILFRIYLVDHFKFRCQNNSIIYPFKFLIIIALIKEEFSILSDSLILFITKKE